MCSDSVGFLLKPRDHDIDDDADPAPLQLLKRQVDSLLMLPPSDTTLMAQKAPK